MNKMISIKRSITVAADQERVWKAITQPEQIKKWFDTFQIEKLAPGETMIMYHDGKVIATCRIAAVEPPSRFAFYWPLEPGYAAETLVTYFLESVPEGTRITVTEEGFDSAVVPEELRERRFKLNSEGWGIAMDGLAKYLGESTHV